ncbi:MAG TPA: class I SAM-dependent methyltransferase [Sedimentisphaerales bacterium]|nr:class I SAM-dependent methyltransferase [Sedimentisphaerales bacterium]
MSLFGRLSRISRERKLRLFEAHMKPAAHEKVLDLGAQVSGEGQDVQFIDWYPWKENITAVNISPEHTDAIKKRYPMIDVRVADARRLPWPDKHFDIVFSNAVIEHVGSEADQRQMASEIMRVGKRWFVTTPNRWYPFEFHMRLPFVTWLPRHGYLWFSRIVFYSSAAGRYIWGGWYSGPLRLVGAGDLRKWFPQSRIIKQRVTFMSETLVVIGPIA